MLLFCEFIDSLPNEEFIIFLPSADFFVFKIRVFQKIPFRHITIVSNSFDPDQVLSVVKPDPGQKCLLKDYQQMTLVYGQSK